MAGRILIFAIPVANFILWSIQWGAVIGFNSLRHDKMLWVPMALFPALCAIQIASDSLIAWSKSEESRKPRPIETPVSIAASVLVAVAIVASVPILPKDLPILSEANARVYWAALMAFLWIVLGVFAIHWLDREDHDPNTLVVFAISRLKLAVLLQALSWAGTSAILLVYVIRSGVHN